MCLCRTRGYLWQILLFSEALVLRLYAAEQERKFLVSESCSDGVDRKVVRNTSPRFIFSDALKLLEKPLNVQVNVELRD